MKNIVLLAGVLITAAATILGGAAVAQQDRSTLKVPDGLTFAEFDGYQSWEAVSVSQNDGKIKLIAANPIMIEAFKKGVSGDGQFPEGSRIVKLEWSRKVNATSPAGPIAEPDLLQAVEFIVKDTKRFPKTKGWAYALFGNNAATNTITPIGSGTVCGVACHTKAANQDTIFSHYASR
jgi:hypothetical protein